MEPKPTSAPLVATEGLVLAGRYKLQRPIASGGMAQVWRGYDEILDRNVAVKILHSHLAHDDKAFVTRFRREAVAAARLSHDSIVAIYDTISTNKLEAIVMELIEGKTLRTVLNEQPTLAAPEIARIGIHICEALSEAHRYGIIHRDIKPANIILGPDRVMVTDFGIAKAGDDIDLTATGTLLGTAKYLAPEQVLGEKIDPRSDLYSLGIVLYEAATGTVPFLADTDAATALKRLHRDPPKARSINSEVPGALERILDRSLARNADDRFRRSTEFKAALQRLIGDDEDLDAKGGEHTAEYDPFVIPQAAKPKRRSSVPTKKPPQPTVRKRRSRTGSVSLPTKKDRHRPFSAPGTEAKPQPRTTGRISSEPTALKPVAKAEVGGVTRSWSIRAIALLAIVTGLVAFMLLSDDDRTGEGPAAPATATIQPLGVQDFDPLGDNQERSDLADNATDGDPTSAWQTEEYATANFGNGLKEGVGLLINIEPGELSSVEISSETDDWSMDVFVADSFSDDPDSWGISAARFERSSGTAVRAFSDPKPSGSQVLLWITDHGLTEGKNLFRLDEVLISR